MALSNREKMMLAVPVVLGGIFAFWHFVHDPLFARRAEALVHSEQVQTELQRDQARLAREGDLKSRQTTVAAREQLVDSWVPGKDSASLFIWYLSQAEIQSGARIKGITVGEKKVVSATAQEGQQGAEGPAPTLTVVQLDLKVEARFAEHLLFNQSLEAIPLFLNTDALALERAGNSPVESVTKLVEDGESWLAAQLLRTSPPVAGNYQINLYFKSGKAGPGTDVMSFGQQAGRVDPFVMDSVDEFIRTLLEYYLNGTNPNWQNPYTPGSGTGQLG